MKDVIKEKLLKEKNEIEDDGCGEIGGDRGEYTCLGKGIYLCILCRERLIELEAQLQQHEETSKAKDEEFNHFIDNFDFDPYLNEQEKVEIRALMKEEIKQRIKENEE